MDVMDKELKVPKLRFKDDGGREFPQWKERSFRDITYVPNSKSVDGKVYPVYSISNVDGFVSREVQFSEGVLEYADKSKCKVVLPGTFAYNPARINVGSIGYQNLAFPVMVSPLYVVFNVIHEVNDKFMWYLLHSDLLLKQICKFAEGSVRVCFSYDKLCKVALSLPMLPEQRKIADFLSAYDELIDNQKKRVEALKLRKKGLLQKIFSQEIRFKDDEGREFPKWKEKTIREISMLVTKQTGFDYTNVIKSSLVTSPNDDTLPYLQTKNFSGLHFNYKTDYYISRKYGQIYPKLFLNEPCLLMSIVGASVGNIGLFSGETHCFLSGAICVIRLSPGENINYVYQYMIASRFQQKVKLNTKTGAQATITIEDIRSLSIKYPTLPEQRKIADFLSVADHQIALEEKRLDTMRLIKKALLQQLFV